MMNLISEAQNKIYNMTDNLSICPKCASDACYVTPINEFHNGYYCFGCGFQTSDLQTEGEFNFEEYEETLPELFKDLKHKDDKGRVWYPTVINVHDKGMVFPNGPGKDNWGWAATLAEPVPEEEKQKYPIPGSKDEYYTHRMNKKSLQMFQPNEFIEACDYIGVFDK